MVKNIKLTVNKIARIIFVLFSFFIFVARTENFLDYFENNNILLILALLVMVLTLFLCFKYRQKLVSLINSIYTKIDFISYKKMALILVGISLFTKILFLVLFQIDPTKHSDISMYWSFIKQISSSNYITDNAKYASSWPHTVMMSLFYSLPAKIIGTDNIYVYIVLNILILTISSYLIFSAITYLKDKNIAFVSALLWIIIPVGIMQPLMLIHENTIIFVHSLTFYLYFKIVPSQNRNITRNILITLIFITLAFESTINQFALVAIIAVLIDLIIKNIRPIIKLLFIAVSFLSLFIAHDFENSYIDSHVAKTDIDTSITIPYGWTFYLGMNYETGGVYSSDDAETWYKYESTNDEELIIKYEKSLIISRITEYTENPIKIIKHLSDKMQVIWSDYNPVGYRGFDGKCFGNELCQKFNDSKLDTVVYIIVNYINALVAFLMFILCLKTKNETDDDYICYSKLFIIGVNIILLFIEVMPKYSSHLPMVYLWILGYLIFKSSNKTID